MPLYTFFLHDGPESMPRFELELLDSPEAAVAHGQALLAKRPHYSAVTIAEGEVEIGRVDRAAHDPSPAVTT